MSYNFRKYDPHQLLLLPPNLDDWLPQQHLARFLADVVEALDLKPLLRRYRGNGQGGAAFSTVMMLKILLYAYCVGVPSSRKIAQALIDDVAFRWLAAGTDTAGFTDHVFALMHLLGYRFAPRIRDLGASGLNLVTAAIVLWNTVYLERATNALRSHGQPVDKALLEYLSPLGWEHINLTGDYLWRRSAKLGPRKFRPLLPFKMA